VDRLQDALKMPACKQHLFNREVSKAEAVAALLIVAAVASITAVGAHAQTEPALPGYVGYVNDFVDMLSPQAEQVITGIAREVKAKTGAEIAVVTVSTVGGADIEEYSVELFMAWGIGEKGMDNGVLLLVALDDRQLWIKPGYGLEGAIPDAEAHRLYRDILQPGFRAGQYDQALVTATGQLAQLILAESGEALAFADSAAYGQLIARRHNDAQRAAAMRTYFMLLSFFFPLGIFIALRVLAARRGYAGRRTGFWIGGFGGSSGGFGGGFGGFGGGSAGGAGAGGGW
jgi:uncharacterized protein